MDPDAHPPAGSTGGGPTDVAWVLSAGGSAKFVGEQFSNVAWALSVTLLVVGMILVVRLLARRTDVTVLIVVALFVGWNHLMVLGMRPAAISAWRLLMPVVLYSLLFVWCSGDTGHLRSLPAGSSPVSRLMLPGRWTCPAGTRGGSGSWWR